MPGAGTALRPGRSRRAWLLVAAAVAAAGCGIREPREAPEPRYAVKWAPLAGAKAGDRPTLTALSVNLRVDLPGDDEHRWRFRRDLLAELLAETGADVIGTQEGWPDQLRDLEARLPGMELVEAHRTWDPERLHPSLLVDTRRIEVLASGDFWLSGSPEEPGSRFFGSLHPRMATWAVCRLREDGETFLAVDTHLTHLLGWVRARQARVLAEQLLRINTSGLPVVVLGDFNEAPDGRVREILAEALPGLVDPWRALGEEDIQTYHGFGGWAAGGGRIDWILLERCFRPLAVSVLTRLDYDPRRRTVVYPSDHLPVAVRAGVCRGGPGRTRRIPGSPRASEREAASARSSNSSPAGAGGRYDGAPASTGGP